MNWSVRKSLCMHTQSQSHPHTHTHTHTHTYTHTNTQNNQIRVFTDSQQYYTVFKYIGIIGCVCVRVCLCATDMSPVTHEFFFFKQNPPLLKTSVLEQDTRMRTCTYYTGWHIVFIYACAFVCVYVCITSITYPEETANACRNQFDKN